MQIKPVMSTNLIKLFFANLYILVAPNSYLESFYYAIFAYPI